MRHLINVGLVAHVDAGKTTTTEQMLYQSGRIRTLGRVDEGTAHTDWLSVERTRGISVRAAVTRLSWGACDINLIDTPGHVDFSAEVERSLQVLDAAILVISAVEGVQAHTETIWQALRALGLPTFVYVNKVDREGIEIDELLRDLRQTLHEGIVPTQTVDAFGPAFTQVTSILCEETAEQLVSPEYALSIPQLRHDLHILLADTDDELMETYVNGDTPSLLRLTQTLWRHTKNGQAFPLFFGASLRGIGIAELLTALTQWAAATVPAEQVGDAPLSGTIFKIERDRANGRVAYVRLFSGHLRNRDTLYNSTQAIEEKVTQIRRIDAETHTDTGYLEAGDVGALYGLQRSRIGDVLGVPSQHMNPYALSVALLTTQVRPVNDSDYHRLSEAMQELDAEDPALSVEWRPDVRELHMKVMGVIQLEVYKQLIEERFGITVTFSPPAVIYQETPVSTAYGYVAYTMPKPCWAILRFLIEPGPRGSGLVYRSEVRAENLLSSYQNEVQRRVPEALAQGMFGFAVTDLAVTLVEGEHHVWHTHPLDFVVATPMAIMDGLRAAGTQLLEPILQFRVSVPEVNGGRVLSDLAQMRAEYDSPTVVRGKLIVEGTIPLATSLDYPLQIGALTGGRGVLATRFLEYRLAPASVTASRERYGVNPLDTARYILAARSALGRL
ncbi:MAG: TetM/TetW/TetO/TetS family tetracycline resistance ribosomal protection protein [Firmicutes bacterium]|nr:TetM/TetW/TetO/TetS family tetracycline resistance ribosomal protection protein [Bacillota bacterium]